MTGHGKQTTGTDLVDSDDHLALLHSCEMLDSSRDPHSHVKFGGDDFPSLTDLERVVCVSRIDGRSGGSDGYSPGQARFMLWSAPPLGVVMSERKGRVCDSPAVKLSARGSMIELNCSALLSARPPETTRGAEERSGRDEMVSSSERCLVAAITRVARIGTDGECQAQHELELVNERLDSLDSLTASILTTSAPLSAPSTALSKAVVLTVTTLTRSFPLLVFISKIAFPA